MLSCFVKVELTTKVATCFPSSLTDPDQYLLGPRNELNDVKNVFISNVYIKAIDKNENTFHQLHFMKSHHCGDHSALTLKHMYWNQNE